MCGIEQLVYSGNIFEDLFFRWRGFFIDCLGRVTFGLDFFVEKVDMVGMDLLVGDFEDLVKKNYESLIKK